MLDVECLTAAAEVGSEHPLGGSIVAAATERNLLLSPVRHFGALSGEGIVAIVGDDRWIGSGRKRRTHDSPRS